MTNDTVLKLQEILNKGLKDKAYSCYAAAVGKGNEVFFRQENTDALFDMASLTKLIATTMVALKLTEAGKISLSNSLSEYFNNCYEKENITIKDLMTHTSGITAHFPLWKCNILPEKAVDRLLKEPLVTSTGTRTIYSCMGYILLGFILEKATDTPLDSLVSDLVLTPLGMNDSCFCPAADRNCVPTENVCGVVHDENAAFLGGVAGNAGLFSTLDDTIKFAQMLSERGKGFLSPEIFSMSISEKNTILPDGRGLGFQLYRGGSFPVGEAMSYGSYGHTGFTGTSLYVDKATGEYTILLTNRICYGRDNTKGLAVRREFYTTVYEELKGAVK